MSVSPPSAAPSASSEVPRRLSALSYAAWLVGPLLVAIVAAKLHKVWVIPDATVGAALAALFSDFGISIALLLLIAGALRLAAGRWWVIPVRVVAHLLIFVLTFVVFVEHGFWLTTGTMLDPYTFGYGMNNFRALGKVYLSEMHLGVWLGLLTLLLVHALPLLALRRARLRPTAKSRSLLIPATLTVATLGTTGAALAWATIPPALAPLTDSVLVTYPEEAFVASASASLVADDLGAPAFDGSDGVTLGTGPRALPEGAPPNVLLIVLESTRASATSVYTPSLDTTPFLASLAARGAKVDTAWTAVTHTSKSLVGILCGLFPKFDLPIEEADPSGLPGSCLPNILKARGYATAFMQVATASFEARTGLTQNLGFDTFRSQETIPRGSFEETSYFGWEDAALIAPAVQWVKEQGAAKRPFFMTLLTLSTHHTYATPTGFTKRAFTTDGPYNDYLNALAYSDATLRELFRQLAAEGALERTLVIITGDHGEGFGEHGRLQHDAVIYEEGLHVPMVLVGPGITPGQPITGLRQTVDIMPTVLDWLGTPVLSGIDGESLLSGPGHELIFGSCWFRDHCIATRDARYKYIWHFGKRTPELFDLTNDPDERSSVLRGSPAPEVEAIAAHLRQRLLSFKLRIDQRWAQFAADLARTFTTSERPEPESPRPVDLAAAPGEAPLVRFLGFDGGTRRVTSGKPVSFTLYWEPLKPLGENWKPFIHLIGVSPGAQDRVNLDETASRRRVPSATWAVGDFIIDPVRIHPGTPLRPGTYDLVVGLWNQAAQGDDRAQRATPTTTSPDVTLDEVHRAHVLRLEVVPAP